MTAVDAEVEVDVDLDKPVVCQIFPPPGPCLTPATWEARMVCCGFSALLCAEHRRWSLDIIATKILSGLPLICELCEKSYVPPTWRPL